MSAGSVLMGGAAAFSLDLLSACSSSGSHRRATTVARGGTLVLGTGHDPTTLNPIVAIDAFTLSICALMFDPLYEFDDQQNPVPLLASAAPHTSADGKTLTIPLRPDARWSDGRPITADDVVWSWQLVYDPRYTEVNYPNRTIMSAAVERMTAADSHTVTIQTRDVYAPFLLMLGTVPILPKHVLGDLGAKDINTSAFNAGPSVTSGAFKFKEWSKGEQLTLVKNENYYKGQANLDQFVVRVAEQLTPALKTGEVDVAEASAADINTLRASGLSIVTVDSFTLYYFAPNLDPVKRGSRLFADPHVRKALYTALDRKAIGDAVFFGTGTVPDSIFSRTSWVYSPPTARYPHDPGAAGRMLDAAGWRRGADGVRVKDGERFSFTIAVSNAAERVNQCQALKAQWQQIGVEMQIAVLSSAEWIQQITHKRQYEAILLVLEWGGQDPDQSSLLSSQSAAPGGFNCMDYRSPTVDRLLDDGVATLDRARRKQIYRRLADAVMTDLPLMPLVDAGTSWALRRRVHNYKLGPFTELVNWYWVKDVSVSKTG